MSLNTIHRFEVEGIDGDAIHFAQFKGKKILVVNVASHCGYTPQYQQLEELYEHFRDKLTVVGLPCNDFGAQEPGTHEEIRRFCETRYGISFPMAAKVAIREPHTHPLFRWLCRKSENGVLDVDISWNFHKFLIDEKGIPLAHFPSAVSPLDEVILDQLEPS